MAYQGNPSNSTLYGLYKMMHGADPSVESSRKYVAGTKTLYADSSSMFGAKAEQKEMHYQLEEAAYRRIVDGTVKYIVVKEPAAINMPIYIEETKNWIPTGRRIIKDVNYVESSIDVKGLQEGYYIVSWL